MGVVQVSETDIIEVYNEKYEFSLTCCIQPGKAVSWPPTVVVKILDTMLCRHQEPLHQSSKITSWILFVTNVDVNDDNEDLS